MEQEIGRVLDAAGLAGVAAYLGSYALLQAGLIRGQGYLYAALNILAASLVLASLASSFNLSSMLIQVSWIAISLFGILRFFLLTRRLQFSCEEQELLDWHFPGLPRLAGRRILDAGHWSDRPAGAVLAREGKVLGRLVHLHKGAARVTARGVHVGDLTDGALIGEVTVLRGGIATADVVLTEPTRVFEITSRELEKAMGKDTQTRMLLEACLARDLGRKLVDANRRLSR